MSGTMNVVGTMLVRTPLFVWVMLVWLVYRGWKMRNNYAFSVGRACITPVVFALWGLEPVVFGFHDVAFCLGIYGLAVAGGVVAGYALYTKTRTIYQHEGAWFATGSFVPLCLVIVIFAVKYALNVVMNAQPAVMAIRGFEVWYVVASGVTVGLFVGGIVQGIRAQSCVNKDVAWKR